MAFFTILRKSAASRLPLMIRSTIGTQRNYYSAILNPLKNSTLSSSHEFFRRSSLPVFNFSSLAKKSNSDEKLLGVIESEIECAQEIEDTVDEMPDAFPFEIEDEPGRQTISLKRQYQGEVIKVEVHVPQPIEDEEEQDEEEQDDDNQPSIAMVVSVSKGKKDPCLEFGITAYPDKISIDSLLVRDPEASEDDLAYEGPEFSDLDENLQSGFYKYLEDRDIKPSTTNFLYQYMMNKEGKEYLLWLKNLKYFMEK